MTKSGLPYVIVRASGVETADETLGQRQGIKMGTLGTLSPSLPTSKQQASRDHPA